MIHANHCGNLQRVNPARILPAYWSSEHDQVIEDLTITLSDRSGILADLTQVIHAVNVNIISIQTISRNNAIITLRLSLELPRGTGDFRSRLIDRILTSVIGIQSIE